MPRSCLFLVLVWIWLLQLMLVPAEELQQKGCPVTTRCGNLTISHPFWLSDPKTGRSCGLPDYEVACYHGYNYTIPILRSSIPLSSGFAIIGISYEERNLRVVDIGKLEPFSASDDSCYATSMSTSVKLAKPFKVNPNPSLLIMYNCTEPAATAARRDPALVDMRCGDESNTTFVRGGGRYNVSDKYEDYYMEGCISTFLPVLGTSGEANASDYEKLIKGGFLLTWDPHPPHPLAHRETGVECEHFDEQYYYSAEQEYGPSGTQDGFYVDIDE